MAKKSIAKNPKEIKMADEVCNRFFKSDKLSIITAGVIIKGGNMNAYKFLTEVARVDPGLFVKGTWYISARHLSDWLGISEKYLLNAFVRTRMGTPSEFPKLPEKCIASGFFAEELGGPVEADGKESERFISARLALAITMFMVYGRKIPKGSKVQMLYELIGNSVYAASARSNVLLDGTPISYIDPLPYQTTVIPGGGALMAHDSLGTPSIRQDLYNRLIERIVSDAAAQLIASKAMSVSYVVRPSETVSAS